MTLKEDIQEEKTEQEDGSDELLEMIKDKLEPTTNFILTSFRFHTPQGSRIMIPERSIDYFYEGPKGQPFLRTKSGKNIEILEDIFSFMRWEDEQEDEECDDCENCEFKDDCEDKPENIDKNTEIL